jgi:hypothetical protein
MSKGKAIGYVWLTGSYFYLPNRVSDDVAKQSLPVIRFARENGFDLAAFFFDEYRGKGDALGPRFQDLVTKGSRGELPKVVIIGDMYQLTQDVITQEAILHDLKSRGFRVLFATTAVEYDDTRDLLRRAFSVLDRYRSTNIHIRLVEGRNRIISSGGRCGGAKPYGSLPGEASIVEKMKTLRNDGIGFDRIADELNKEGLRPRRGRRWYGATVNGIIGPLAKRKRRK